MDDNNVDIAHSSEFPPHREKGWNHTEQVLVYYPPEEERLGKYGIAYYHYDPPHGGPKWIDFNNYSRVPIYWWKLPSPPQK